MKMFLCDIGTLFQPGVLVIHADVPASAKVCQVGKVQRVLPDGEVEVNWDKGAAFGEYSAAQLIIYDPY